MLLWNYFCPCLPFTSFDLYNLVCGLSWDLYPPSWLPWHLCAQAVEFAHSGTEIASLIVFKNSNLISSLYYPPFPILSIAFTVVWLILLCFCPCCILMSPTSYIFFVGLLWVFSSVVFLFITRQKHTSVVESLLLLLHEFSEPVVLWRAVSLLVAPVKELAGLWSKRTKVGRQFAQCESAQDLRRKKSALAFYKWLRSLEVKFSRDDYTDLTDFISAPWLPLWFNEASIRFFHLNLWQWEEAERQLKIQCA